jgi:hypothetical protein
MFHERKSNQGSGYTFKINLYIALTITQHNYTNMSFKNLLINEFRVSDTVKGISTTIGNILFPAKGKLQPHFLMVSTRAVKNSPKNKFI